MCSILNVKNNMHLVLAINRVMSFIESLYDGNQCYYSVPNRKATLYGTCYAVLTSVYTSAHNKIVKKTFDFILNTQDKETGYFIGPEIKTWCPPKESKHNREHLLMHLTSATLPVCQQFHLKPPYPLKFAHAFCDSEYLNNWLENRDMSNAWLEGNNLLFVAQFLIYLRDVELYPGAGDALLKWFDWLDKNIEPETGLWGARKCGSFNAMCGGYHQLLVYYHENHPIKYSDKLVDTVLGLQHWDGGFSPNGGGGACEDVDAVDILVNMYKRYDYRRAEIRYALRRCLMHILSTQNPDGGFSYKQNQNQSHMGIPDTIAEPNVSCAFPTWFRIHTLALIAEVLPNEPTLKGIQFKFNKALSMGWHESPDVWTPLSDEITIEENLVAFQYRIKYSYLRTIIYLGKVYRFANRFLYKLKKK
jgi:hypothetical protein